MMKLFAFMHIKTAICLHPFVGCFYQKPPKTSHAKWWKGTPKRKTKNNNIITMKFCQNHSTKAMNSTVLYILCLLQRNRSHLKRDDFIIWIFLFSVFFHHLWEVVNVSELILHLMVLLLSLNFSMLCTFYWCMFFSSNDE